jgi:hypothetical protein
VEVRAVKVGYGLKVLLPYRVLLILNREKCDRQRRCSCEAVLAQGGEGDVRHHFNAGVGLTTDDRPLPWVRGVKWYCHANLAPVQVMNPGQSTMVDRSVVVVTKANECIVHHSQEPWAMQARRT